MLKLRNPLDMHIHLREGAMLESVIDFTAKHFLMALAMPNLSKPLMDTSSVIDYRNAILKASSYKDFSPIMSLYLNENLNRLELQKAKDNDIKILKLYPKGATTGSESGVSEILSDKILEILEIAQELGFILSIHGESNGFSLEREFEFGEVFERLATSFPKLKIIMEHLSDRRSIKLLEKHSNLFATLTLHHISLDLDSLLGFGLNPHYFCKPILKSKKDKEALLSLALEAHPKVSFGSDSAPHLESAKLRVNGSAGIFSAPILLPRLCEIFDEHKKLDNLQSFISNNAFKIYDLKEPKTPKIIRLENEPYKVMESIPLEDSKIIPLCANECLKWRVL